MAWMNFAINFIILAAVLNLTQYFTTDDFTLRMVLTSLVLAALGGAVATYLFKKLGV